MATLAELFQSLGSSVNTMTDDLRNAELENKMAEDDLGVSGTDVSQIPMGVLNALSGNRGQLALDYANQAIPMPEEANKYEAALRFFLEMGKQASQPGSTVLGSAFGAGQAPLDYLTAKNAEIRKAKQARASLGLQIAPSLKPKAVAAKTTYRPATADELKQYGAAAGQMGSDGKFYDLSKTAGSTSVSTFGIVDGVDGRLALETILGKPVAVDDAGNVVLNSADQTTALNAGLLIPKQSVDSKITTKTIGQGTLAEYMSEDDARKFVKDLGLPEDNPNFERIVGQITAGDSSQLGRAVTQAGVYLELFPVYQNENMVNLQLSPSKTAAKPYYNTYVDKRLPLIAKAVDTYNTQAREVLPRAREAMALLKTGRVQTGALSAALMPFKQVFNQAFGVNDPEVRDLETLQATSNFMAPKMRPVGSGSTSDMEFTAYQKAALYLGNSPEANYISLYAFAKMAENGIRLNQLEQELLTSGDYSDMASVNAKLKIEDAGIFEKYTGDPNDDAAIQAFYDSVPDGAVIINNDIFDSPSSYIIKGWGT